MNPPPAELDLIRRAALGDCAAFRDLAASYAEMLWRCASSLCGDRHLAEDLAQETLLEAWRSLARFDGRCQFSTWLYGILRHRFLKARTRQKPVDLTDELPERWGERSHSPADSAEREEDTRRIAAALRALPEVHRVVIELRFFAGASLAEIADLVACPLGTVKSRLHQGLEKLRLLDLSVNLFASSRESPRELP